MLYCRKSGRLGIHGQDSRGLKMEMIDHEGMIFYGILESDQSIKKQKRDSLFTKANDIADTVSLPPDNGRELTDFFPHERSILDTALLIKSSKLSKNAPRERETRTMLQQSAVSPYEGRSMP